MTAFSFTPEFAAQMDAADPLKAFREEFIFPQHHGKDMVYFTGNSLGLQPKAARHAIDSELEDWAGLGVEGHFKGRHPWKYYHRFLTDKTARLVGALPEEVVVMNNLTTNLHLMMVSFYQPTHERFKIIMEGGAFPSDQYAVESQVRFHGYKPEDAIIEITPRPGEHTLRTEDILDTIQQHGASTALVLFGGVNYYTGQFFNLQAIAAKAREVGAHCGFDLAHAAGNMPLELHNWGPDFAVWCSYKYLNSGPGGTSGVFVHGRHAENPDLPRFAGWWGHNEEERFQMRKGFKPMRGAAGWQLSNAQIFPMAIHKASLEIFDRAGIDRLREKSLQLTAYLEFVLENLDHPKLSFEIITPKNPAERGCQISVLVKENGLELYDYLTVKGVVTDWREPNVIRMAPVPLYNTFTDIYTFGKLMQAY